MPVFYINALKRFRADSMTALTQINEFIAQNESYVSLLNSPKYAGRWNQVQISHKSRLQRITAEAAPTPDGHFGTAYLINQVRKAVPEDAIYVIEAITNTQIVAEQLQLTRPGSWYNCGGGGLGWSGGGVSIPISQRQMSKEIVVR
jgi:thiamine pyrophosphate-dependent acetolactate synthase large subunit-like protein